MHAQFALQVHAQVQMHVISEITLMLGSRILTPSRPHALTNTWVL